MRIQRGGGQEVRTPPPLKNHKNTCFLAKLMQDPLKVTNLPSQHSNGGHYQHASDTPFQWRFAGMPMMAHFSGISIISTSHRPTSVGPPLTKLSGSTQEVDIKTNKYHHREISRDRGAAAANTHKLYINEQWGILKQT